MCITKQQVLQSGLSDRFSAHERQEFHKQRPITFLSLRSYRSNSGPSRSVQCSHVRLSQDMSRIPTVRVSALRRLPVFWSIVILKSIIHLITTSSLIFWCSVGTVCPNRDEHFVLHRKMIWIAIEGSVINVWRCLLLSLIIALTCWLWVLNWLFALNTVGIECMAAEEHGLYILIDVMWPKYLNLVRWTEPLVGRTHLVKYIAYNETHWLLNTCYLILHSSTAAVSVLWMRNPIQSHNSRTTIHLSQVSEIFWYVTLAAKRRRNPRNHICRMARRILNGAVPDIQVTTVTVRVISSGLVSKHRNFGSLRRSKFEWEDCDSHRLTKGESTISNQTVQENARWSLTWRT
jgi:hypothetical protein